MNDEITGTAVLSSDVSPADGYEYLFVVCSSPARKTVQTAAIPIRAEGQPNPGNRGWTYKERGEFLDCKPSLKMSALSDPSNSNSGMVETFHNSYAWSVKFVRRPLAECSDALRELNPSLKEETA